MAFYIKEIFYSLQGEGFYTGRPAVFCRFTGCNLWSGKEKDRSKAKCSFCDTDFVNADGGIFPDEESLGEAIYQTFPKNILNNAFPKHKPYVIFTGGEPSLQLTSELILYLKKKQLEVAIETNGTCLLPKNLDWITVSPKGKNPLITNTGNELKLVWPQKDCTPEDFTHLKFTYFFLQPKDDINLKDHIQKCISYCMQHPYWRLSLQTHKWIGIP